MTLYIPTQNYGLFLDDQQSENHSNFLYNNQIEVACSQVVSSASFVTVYDCGYEESRSCKASLTCLHLPMMSGETCGRVTSACPGPGGARSRCRGWRPRSCGRHTRGDDAAMPRLPGPGQPNKRSAPPHPGPQRGISQLLTLATWDFRF